jgi:hypothetical protein
MERSEMSLEHSPSRQGRRAAFTIAEFCEAHRISRATYYNLKAAGQGPIEMAVGARRIISDESAEDWRRQREAAAAQSNPVPAA